MTPRPVDRSEKRSQILEAAARFFVERGYRSATVDEIAERAGIGKGTVYLYFRSKDDILMAVFEEFMGRMLQQLEGWVGSTDAPAEERLRAVNEIAAAGVDEMRSFYPLFFEFWAAAAAGDLRARIAPIYRRIYDRLRRDVVLVVEDGVRRGEFLPETDPRAVAALWVGAIDGLGLQAWFEPTLDVRALARGFFDALLRGLAVRHGAPPDQGCPKEATP